jgi:hypothetical protein
MAGKVSKTLEKYGTIAQHQLAIRQSGFFGFVTTKILNRFLAVSQDVLLNTGGQALPDLQAKLALQTHANLLLHTYLILKQPLSYFV